jgi:hypothetical protein
MLMSTHWVRTVCLAVAVFAAAGGVGACASTTVSGTPAAQGAAASAAAPPAGGAAADSPTVDGCSLLTADEVKALIGGNDGGKSGSTPGGGDCQWTNTGNEFSVSVEVSRTGTAPNDTLPTLDPAFGDPKPLGDGMREFAGAVEFATRTRRCQVQVSTLSGDGDIKKAAALVPKLKDRIS